MASATHADIAPQIDAQVEQMILQAKQDSEVRVERDLSVAKSQLHHMQGLVTDLNDRVARSVAASNDQARADNQQTVDHMFLSQKVAQLEAKWGQEVKALKQDLHRTILAHNHNSDLMRIHRDSLDDASKKLEARSQPKPEIVDQQVAKVDSMLRAGQAKQRTIDTLTEQMAQLELHAEDLLAGGAAAGLFPGMMPGMLSGMSGPGGMNPHVMAAQMAQRENAMASSGKKASKKEESLSANPAEDDVRARLLQAARHAGGGAAGGADSGFNVQAPAFVPGGFAAANGPGDDAGGDDDDEGDEPDGHVGGPPPGL